MPGHTETPNLPPTQSRVFPPPLETGPSDAQGSHPMRTPMIPGKGAQVGTPLVLPAPPHTARGAHSPVKSSPANRYNTSFPLPAGTQREKRPFNSPLLRFSLLFVPHLGSGTTCHLPRPSWLPGSNRCTPTSGTGKRLHPRHPPDRIICRWPPTMHPGCSQPARQQERAPSTPLPAPPPRMPSPPRRAPAGASCPPSSASPRPPLPARAGAWGGTGGARGVPRGAGRLGPGLRCSPRSGFTAASLQAL